MFDRESAMAARYTPCTSAWPPPCRSSNNTLRSFKQTNRHGELWEGSRYQERKCVENKPVAICIEDSEIDDNSMDSPAGKYKSTKI